MKASSLKLYHALPAPLRSLAASLQGYRLRVWRYGPDTDRLAQEALERECWSGAVWQAWQNERLAYLLNRAAARVPYYREYWTKQGARGSSKLWAELARWPVLRKETVRATPEAFLADDVDNRSLYSDSTSGTTGTPLRLWHSRQTLRQRYAIFEARTRLWHGVSRHDRWGIIGGKPVVAQGRRQPPFWVWNAALNQLYLSAMHIAPWSAPAYLKAIREYNLKFVLGYSSSLYHLALEAERVGERLDNVKALITNAEPLYAHQRRVIQKAFAGRLQETYGMAEAVCMASECSHGRLHLWPEFGVVEILDEKDRPVPAGEPGRIVATGLLNPDMPLIRYDTGDRGQMGKAESTCACGRLLPWLEKVWGRWDDVVVTRDGRRLGLLDRIFEPPVRVKEGQIIQETLDTFRLRVLPAEGWSETDKSLLRKALLELVGDVEVIVEVTPNIERTWAGKFRVIVSNVTGPERSQHAERPAPSSRAK